MHDQPAGSPEAQEGSGGDQPEGVMEGTGQRELQDSKEEQERGMLQCWEAQWQQFLQTLQFGNSAWGSPAVPDPMPWEDAKAFLASFEQVAAACGWPRGEWVARLTPALNGEALQAISLLQARDKEAYGKVKAAILREEALRQDARRQHFRQFRWQKLEDPRKMYIQIQVLCCQWLKPERHTKEQILELLVLEQFLASLPEEAQSWVRAGGLDSYTQAVALLEDFLMSRRMAETGTWQEPLEECAVGCLDPKQEHLDMVQVEISKEHAEMFKDTEQNVDDAFAVPCIGIACQTSLLSPGREALNETELTKALEIYEGQMKDLKKMGLPLQMTEQIPVQSSQQTTFWKVLQEEEEENEENVDESSRRAHQIIDQIPLSVCSDDGKRDQLKVKNAPVGGSDPVQRASSGKGETQKKMLVKAEMKEEKYQSKSRQGIEPEYQELSELREGLGAPCSNAILVDTEGGAALSSNFGRRYHRRLDQHHSSQMEVKYNDVLEQEVSLNSSAKYHRIHTGEKKYRCTNRGKKFWRSNLLRYGMSHNGEKPHKCPECGKTFSWRAHLLRHEMIHTGEKPHKCLECGKTFSSRAYLLQHEMIHTGEKPHKCPECGKTFFWRAHLLRHEMIHTGEKPHKCPECGKTFFWRAHLLRHEMIHTGEKPHKCPECGKTFSQRVHLLRHEMIHTGEKPHKCPECGKTFSSRAHLSRHEMIHTGENPHKCPECGKTFSQRTSLLQHEMIHSGEKPRECGEWQKLLSETRIVMT